MPAERSEASGLHVGVDQVLEEARKRVSHCALTQFAEEIEVDLARTESPLEKMFLFALVARAKERYLTVEEMFYSSNVPIGNYRVDFLLTETVIAGRNLQKGSELVVEVDGHDFHERTKEQARHDKQRDRWLISRGYKVVHFTGSEVWKDPFACAEEALDLLFGLETP